MSEIGHADSGVAFWNASASIAAEDPFIQGTLAWLIKCDPPESLARDYYDAMGEHLHREYGIPEGQWNRVFNYCEANILVDEAPHG